jgi:hypothetical protein
MVDPDKAFDFSAHEQAAVTAYLKCHRFYEDLASIVKRIFEETLNRRRLKMDSRELISHRLFRVTYLASGTCSIEVNGRYWRHDTHTITHRRRQMF